MELIPEEERVKLACSGPARESCWKARLKTPTPRCKIHISDENVCQSTFPHEAGQLPDVPQASQRLQASPPSILVSLCV